MTETQALARSESSGWVRRFGPPIVTLVLLGYLSQRIDWNAFVRALSGVSYGRFLAYTLVWHTVLLLCDALGNYVAYRPLSSEVRYADCVTFRGASYLPGMLNHHVGQAYMSFLMARFWRVGIPTVFGATLVSYAGWLGCLLGCVALALPFTELPLSPVWAILVAGSIYLAVVAWAPARLRRVTLLVPLFDAGISGHLRALGARLPHLVVLVLGTWGGYRFFDIDIPLGAALVYMPILLMVATLPVTPQGFGAREAFAATVFSTFVRGSTEGERVGHLTAATSCWGVAMTLAAVTLGLLASRSVRRKLALQEVVVGSGVR